MKSHMNVVWISRKKLYVFILYMNYNNYGYFKIVHELH
jgi:hypothetical protein